MPSRMRPPEDMRLPLSGDDWIVVKKHLTWGEKRDSEVRMMKSIKAGQGVELDAGQLGIALAVAYLLDWSYTDTQGQPVGLRGQGDEVKAAAIRNADPEFADEVIAAVAAHDTAMRELREAEKKTPAGVMP
jgi:hypothetical protein